MPYRKDPIFAAALAMTCALAAATSTMAQTFVDQSSTFTPNVDARLVTAGDFDGDGDIDLVAQAGSATLGRWLLLRNDGAGVYAAKTAGTVLASQWFSSLDHADIDGDGSLDLLVTAIGGASGGMAWVFWNDGTGNFMPAALSNAGPFHQLLPLDIDGDGDLDLIGAAGTAQAPIGSMVFRNTGNRMFANASNLLLPTAPAQRASVAALDVQGDGRTDLVFPGNPVVVMLQNSSGDFVRSPSALSPPLNLFGLQALDLDFDGDLDLVGYDDTTFVRVRNDGNGSFTRLLHPIANVRNYHAADIDGDSDLDFLLQTITSPSNTLWRTEPGLGLLNVTATQVRATLTGTLGTATFLDSDGDGDRDLYLASIADLLHNDGNGTFLDLRATNAPDAPRGVALTDFDADGFVDLIGFDAPFAAGFVGTGDLARWRNNGTGEFTKTGVFGSMQLCDESLVVLFDMDRDGDDDVLALTCGPGDRVWEKIGSTYVERTATAFPADSRADVAVLPHDYDGDGDLDVFVARDFFFDSLYVNQGNMTFVEEGQTRLPDTEDTLGATAFDYDLDGDVDLVLTNATTPLVLYRNDGTGRFIDDTAGQVPSLTTTYRYVLDLDIDGDGDGDLLLDNPTSGQPPALLRNDSGSFVDVSHQIQLPPQFNGRRYWPTAADFDVDGDVDLVLGSYWLQNDGTGQFTMAPIQPTIAAQQNRRATTLADLDGDEDVDLLAAPLRQNAHRHLENRIPPRTGFTAVVRLHALPEAPNWTPFGVLYTAGGLSAPVSVAPFGSLFLDSATLTPLRSLFVTANGSADAAYAIPADPGLIGTTFPLQAIVAHGPTRAHTTNALLVTVEQ